jgi:hypothetical protein
MDGIDVRDLAGRSSRLLLASVLGTVGSIVVALILPERDHAPHWQSCFGKPTNIDFALVIAGAVGLTLAFYAALQFRASRRRRFVFPRATVLTRRTERTAS